MNYQNKLLRRLIYRSMPFGAAIFLALNLFSGKMFLPKEGYVAEVVDGDTIKLKSGESVRYIGIDTPETRKKEGEKWIYQPQPFAEEAKQLNRKLVENKKVRLEYDVEKKDKYRRLLCYVFVEDIFVNAKLIEEGLAFLYTYPPNVKYVDKLVELQKNARLEEKGIWKTYARGAIPDKEAKNHIGELAEVEGRVSKIKDRDKTICLYFGQGGQGSFKVIIFRNDLKYFLDKKINPKEYYLGKKLKVYGKIKDYHGPEIIAGHPTQIEVIE